MSKSTVTQNGVPISSYDEEHLTDSKGKEDVRTVLRLHPALAPYKCAVLPLSKKLGSMT